MDKTLPDLFIRNHIENNTLSTAPINQSAEKCKFEKPFYSKSIFFSLSKETCFTFYKLLPCLPVLFKSTTYLRIFLLVAGVSSGAF